MNDDAARLIYELRNPDEKTGYQHWRATPASSFCGSSSSVSIALCNPRLDLTGLILKTRTYIKDHGK